MSESGETARETGTSRVKRGLAEMLRGGVIMDVVTPEQAKIAEDAGAVAVMALERVPADIRRDGGVARMSDPAMIEGIQATVTIPVMAKCRIGHFAEAQVLESLGVDYIDESEVLTPADEANHVDKWAFTTPFVCGATNLGEALRRISEGACMIRSKGEAGTGNIVEAVRHLRTILGEIRRLTVADEAELFAAAKDHRAPVELVREVAALGELPVPMFCAGGIATPADASLVMQLGAQAVFVGSGIFKSNEPAIMAKAIVEATTHYRDASIVAKVSTNLGEALRRIAEGACLIRSKGEAGTGNIVEAVRHLRSILGDIRRLTVAEEVERFAAAKELRAPVELVQEVGERGELPVPIFCAGGIATPADASLVMQLGAQAVFVGSGIFKSDDPATRAKAIVEATTHFRDASIVAKVSRGLGAAMPGQEIGALEVKLAERGW
jgi:pyridoxal 5'-phosphate synthase pdxS subunit